MGGCQNYVFVDHYYYMAGNILGTQKRIIILTATHINLTHPTPASASIRPVLVVRI